MRGPARQQEKMMCLCVFSVFMTSTVSSVFRLPDSRPGLEADVTLDLCKARRTNGAAVTSGAAIRCAASYDLTAENELVVSK